ncbi:MAG TPA: hypothetical protein VL738_31460 [Dactylosporangium sp.]|nr:hypothetical protein [Dactylosporangium sp.]
MDRFEVRHPWRLTAVGGGTLLVVGHDVELCAYDLGTGALVAESGERFPGINGIAPCDGVDGRPVVAVATEDGVAWWDPVSGGRPHEDDEVSTLWGVAAAAMPDGSVRLFGAAHGHPWPVHCWDAATGRELDPVGFHDCCVMAVAVVPLPDGPIVASADEAGVIRRWRADGGGEVGGALEIDEVRAMAGLVPADGRGLLAAADESGRVYRWNAITGERLGEPIEAGGPLVTLSAATVRGRPELLTVGVDRAVRRWDALTGAPVGEPHAGWDAALFEAGGACLLAASQPDGTVRLYYQS